ncbi:MAG: DUF3597 domain-containing protein [Methylocystis sp.]
MSVLGTIMSKILGKTPAASPASAAESPAPSGTTSAVNAPGASLTPNVDVAAVLDGLKDKATQQLNWKTSIVDLMKLLSMDSSLTARKDLAKELQYSGDTNDSAAMNVWLHKQIMRKLAENGGKLPDDIKHG